MLATLLLLPLGLVAAETGIDAWLRYAPVADAGSYHGQIPSNIVALNSSEVSPVYTAGRELQRGLDGLLGKQCNVGHDHGQGKGSSITVGTVTAYTGAGGNVDNLPELIEDGFYLSTTGGEVVILGQNERGALYGAFHWLEMLALGNFSEVAFASNPDAPIRWVNVSKVPINFCCAWSLMTTAMG
jgi:alpha-glucuronidase